MCYIVVILLINKNENENEIDKDNWVTAISVAYIIG